MNCVRLIDLPTLVGNHHEAQIRGVNKKFFELSWQWQLQMVWWVRVTVNKITPDHVLLGVDLQSVRLELYTPHSACGAMSQR